MVSEPIGCKFEYPEEQLGVDNLKKIKNACSQKCVSKVSPEREY